MVLGCAEVPLRWRRLFAIAVYTYMRAGEIDAIQWPDLDLDHDTMHIHRSMDTRRGKGTTRAFASAMAEGPLGGRSNHGREPSFSVSRTR
jgi:integrase